eukprot:11178489-Lingulodinium_polyedra.AAC.1
MVGLLPESPAGDPGVPPAQGYCGARQVGFGVLLALLPHGPGKVVLAQVLLPALVLRNVRQ